MRWYWCSTEGRSFQWKVKSPACYRGRLFAECASLSCLSPQVQDFPRSAELWGDPGLQRALCRVTPAVLRRHRSRYDLISCWPHLFALTGQIGKWWILPGYTLRWISDKITFEHDDSARKRPLTIGDDHCFDHLFHSVWIWDCFSAKDSSFILNSKFYNNQNIIS